MLLQCNIGVRKRRTRTTPDPRCGACFVPPTPIGPCGKGTGLELQPHTWAGVTRSCCRSLACSYACQDLPAHLLSQLGVVCRRHFMEQRRVVAICWGLCLDTTLTVSHPGTSTFNKLSPGSRTEPASKGCRRSPTGTRARLGLCSALSRF